MKTEIIVHAPEFVTEREFIETEIGKNMNGKLDSYLKKYTNPDAECRLEVTLTRTKKDDNHKDPEFDGKVVLSVDGNSFRSEREGFKRLDDLVSHLFTHVKEQMAK